MKAKSSENFPALGRAHPTWAPSGGSASYQSYASVASGRASELGRAVSPYLAMIIDPHSKEKGCRYPDETIVPTGMVHLSSQVTFTVPDFATAPPGFAGSFYTALRWKVDEDDPSSVIDTDPILAPRQLGTAGPDPWQTYGAPQSTWVALSAIDRTLACGIRVRLVALPTATFLPSGTLYFLQLQNVDTRDTNYSVEATCIQAVTAGKGFSMTVNELSKTDGVTLPYLPQGPMSFVFSDSNSEAAVTAGLGAGAPSTVVSANGTLYVFGFGLQAGMSLRVDFAHHVEYIPKAVAAGLVSTKVESPSSTSRDAISRGAQSIQSALAGATSAGPIRSLVTGGGLDALSGIARAAIGMIPGAAPVLGAAKAMAGSFGAPPWLKSALNFLA